MEESNSMFTAQLCRIKAFQPSTEYKTYLKQKKAEKTRNQLGEDRVTAIRNDDGWNELLRLLNSSVYYDKQKVSFESIGQEQSVSFDYKSQAIKFPRLKYLLPNNNELEETTLSIRISPCISEEVHTKLLIRPTFLRTAEEFLNSPDEVNNFFKETISLTDMIFDVIKSFYIGRIKIDNVDLEPYCNADLYVIGYEKFNQWVKFTINNDKDRILACDKEERYVHEGRRILNNLKQGEEDYKWFSRSRSNINAVYGILGRENYCKVLGIVDNDPRLITADLTQELIAMMDSNGNVKI